MVFCFLCLLLLLLTSVYTDATTPCQEFWDVVDSCSLVTNLQACDDVLGFWNKASFTLSEGIEPVVLGGVTRRSRGDGTRALRSVLSDSTTINVFQSVAIITLLN